MIKLVKHQNLYNIIYMDSLLCRLNLPQEDLQTSLLIGDPSRAYPAIHCVRYM